MLSEGVRLAAGQHKADTMTNKKGYKIGDKGRQQAQKADAMTNKERNRKGNSRDTRQTQ